MTFLDLIDLLFHWFIFRQLNLFRIVIIYYFKSILYFSHVFLNFLQLNWKDSKWKALILHFKIIDCILKTNVYKCFRTFKENNQIHIWSEFFSVISYRLQTLTIELLSFFLFDLIRIFFYLKLFYIYK